MGSPASKKLALPPLPFEDSLGFLVRDLNRAIQRDLATRIQEHGVWPGAWYFLRVLWEDDGLTQSELAQRVGMRAPTAVVALRSMEEHGWIRRERSAEDQRKVHLFLTPAGRALRKAVMPAAYEVNALAAKGLSRAEIHLLKDLLRRARANFEPFPPESLETPGTVARQAAPATDRRSPRPR